MMQWPDNTSSRYSGSPPSKEICSTINSSSAAIKSSNNSSLEARRETSDSVGGTTTADHLQLCLSMLPQTCSFCGVHPLQWGRDEVQQWLKWCIGEFSFTDVQTDKFAMNGKALILLKKEDFIDRASSGGAVLYNVLQKLLESHSKSAPMAQLSAASVAEQAVMLNLMMAANNPFFPHGLLPGFPSVAFPGGVSRAMMSPATGSPLQSVEQPVSSASDIISNTPRHIGRSHSQSPGEIKHSIHLSDSVFPSHGLTSENGSKSLPLGVTLSQLSMPESVIKQNRTFPLRKEEPLDMLPGSPKAKGDCRLLWEFISKLLKDPNYIDFIKWENISDYTFRIVNPAQLSRLWGIQKNRTNMTYEKLSRALRYYYRMDIIEKVPGRRLTYRFMRPPHEIKRGQRGAKPGVPRKSRSTDEETEELDEVEAMEAPGSEPSDDDTRPASNEYVPSISPDGGCFPKRETHMDNTQPIDLVRHHRHSTAYGPATDLTDSTFLQPKTEPLTKQLSATRTNPSLGSVIKSEVPDWTMAKNISSSASSHMAME